MDAQLKPYDIPIDENRQRITIIDACRLCFTDKNNEFQIGSAFLARTSGI